MDIVQSVRWGDAASGTAPDGRSIHIIDQRQLPAREVTRDLRTIDDVCDAITTLSVRGAPAIGIAGAMGLVVAISDVAGGDIDPAELMGRLQAAATQIRSTRPTAVNLGWALDRMLRVAERARGDAPMIVARLRDEASAILAEDRAMCQRIGEHGAELIADGANVLTHCNTGALATGGIGTALGAIYVAVNQGKRIHVYVGETRPLLQGSRLTAWELTRAGIPVTVLADGAVASVMRAGRIDLCIVGADRIAANGDVANKVGTYALALAAAWHDLPFYVAAPSSTFDAATAHGADIRIEQRDPNEVRCGFGVPTAPAGVDVDNPAFDVTPGDLISGIVSDRGVHRPPYDFSHGVE